MSLSDWIEIFKGGKQTDSDGIERDGDDLIESAISKFNTEEHEPPVVIGHPSDNAPAYAWVEGLKRKGNTLMAKFKQVVPEFETMVNSGMFKKRSAAFYPDGRLRHVGFLGAMPPAVKGLKNIGFAAGETTIEFDEYIPQNQIKSSKKEGNKMTFQEMTEFLKFWKENTAPAPAAPVVSFEPVKAAPEPVAAPAVTFSEADLEAAKKEAADAAVAAERERMDIEFAEKEAAVKRKSKIESITAWVDGKVEKGEILPAWKKMGIAEFMTSLVPVEIEFQFSEGDAKQTPVDWFKAFIDELPKTVQFGEFANPKDAAPSGAVKAAIEFDAAIKSKMDADKTKTWGQAFSEVQIERPDMVREYQQSIGG